MRRMTCETSGQATVELAVLMPVVIVVGLILINLGFFIECSSRFDRVSQDMVLAHGASPEGEQSSEHAIAEITEAIKEAMANDSLEVNVKTEKIDMWSGGTFSLNPARIKFVCEMKYKPIPASFSIAGVSIQSPFELSHSRSVVLDAGAIGF